MWFVNLLPFLLVCAASSIVHVNETASKSNTELTKPPLDQPVDNKVLSLVRDERRLYLEDVFYSIKNMDWDEGEHLCLNQTLDLLTNLQNFTLWAVAMWDATASDARGVLYGTRYQLGNYDECLKPVWTTREHPHLNTQYCLADVKLLMKPRNLPKYKIDFSPYQSAMDMIYYTGDPTRRPLNLLTWGTCVPAACAPRSVARLLTTLLHRSNLAAAGLRFNVTVDGRCQTLSDEPYPTDAVAFIAVATILAVVCVACTVVCWYYKNFSGHDDYEGPTALKAFCLTNNLQTLLKKNDSGLDVLYGIRFLSICFIVMSHRFAMFSAGPVSNGWDSDQKYQRPEYSMLVVHDDLLVDTYFFMSGLLISKTLLSVNRYPNVFVLVLKRYFRLAPALAAVVWYMSSVFPLTGSGPLWARAVAYEAEPCRRNWWTNLLMISNYVNVEDMCIVITWYIPCDFHFFLLATWLCYLGRRRLPRALLLAAPLALLSLVIPALVTAHYKLPAIILFFNSFVTDPRGNFTFQKMYIPSHTRFSSYLIGLAVGYVVTKVYPLATTKKLSIAKSTCSAAVGLLIMVIVMASGTIFYIAEKPYNVTEAAIYAALNRPAYTLGLAVVVLSCIYGRVLFVNSFLSWSAWIPLSKMAYGLYLVHTIIIARDVNSSRDPNYFDPSMLIHRAAGDIAWGTVFALLLWLLVEAPCINLLTMFLDPRKPEGESSTSTEAHDTDNTSRFNIPSGSNVPQPSDLLKSKC